MQFVFTTAEADRLDAELRKNYATHPQPRDDRWTSFVTPAFQKAHGVQDLRQAVRMKCSEWFRRYLPGAFSRTKDAPLPSLELISTNDFSGFEDDDRLPTMRNFITVLGLHPTFEAWKLEDLPGVNVGFPRGFEDPETVLTLSLNRNTALGSWNFDGYGTDKDDAMMFQLDQEIQGLAAAWALSVHLRGYERIFGEIRDETGAPGSRLSTSTRHLRQIEKLLVEGSADSQALVRDIKHVFSDTDSLFMDFPLAHRVFQGLPETRTLREVLAQGIKWRSEELEALEDQLRNTLITTATLKSARTNLSLQRLIFALTVLLLVIAALTLWTANRTIERNQHPVQSSPSSSPHASPRSSAHSP
jgi:hypothetical protein